MKKWSIKKVEKKRVYLEPGMKVVQSKEVFDVVFTGNSGKVATLVSEDKQKKCELSISGSRIRASTEFSNISGDVVSNHDQFGDIVVSMGGLFTHAEVWSDPVPVGVGHRFQLKDRHSTSDVHAIVYIGRDGTMITDCNGFTHMFEPGCETLGSCADLHFV